MRTNIAKPATADRVIVPGDVFNVANQSLIVIRAVKKHIGIQKEINDPVFDATKNPAMY
ncbi:MAG: hypothetical protein JKX87_02240 [Cycloclasticus sp.]|nr:hypothetical protein [Cycloclasticus sp.]